MAVDRTTRERAWRAHYVLQDALYGGGHEALSGGDVFFSPLLDDPEWNHAVIEDVAMSRLPGLLAEARAALERHARTATAVISPLVRSDDSQRFLAASGWRPSFRHRWLFYTPQDAPRVETAAAVRVEEVRDEASMRAFVGVFYAAFSTAEDKLSAAYGEALMASWRRGAGGRCAAVHYLATVDGEPVAIGTRIQGDGVAGFYNLGVVPAARRRGIGAVLSGRRLRDALDAGAELILLQTEDDAVRRWQLVQGWEELFTVVGWSR